MPRLEDGPSPLHASRRGWIDRRSFEEDAATGWGRRGQGPGSRSTGDISRWTVGLTLWHQTCTRLGTGAADSRLTGRNQCPLGYLHAPHSDLDASAITGDGWLMEAGEEGCWKSPAWTSSEQVQNLTRHGFEF